ncbi:hypothetical protein JCM11641_001956 [Rhodosporidiobolus odoratus]
MASCSTVSGPATVITSYVTSTYTAEVVSTAPGSTSTYTSTALVTSCATAPGIDVSTVCETSTSTSIGQTVLPGSTFTASRAAPTVIPVYSTQQGAVTTVCQTTSSSTSAPASTTAPSPITTTQQVESPSSTSFATTTLTSVPVDTTALVRTSYVRSTTTLPSEPAATSVETLPTTSQPRLTTSYRIVTVTSVDSAGHTALVESSLPTVLNTPASGSSSSNTGAIAGGVVGGVVALALAALLFFFLCKKGIFRRNEEELEENVWAPRPHSEFYGGAAGKGGGDVDNEKDDALSENEQAVDAATLERHKSWYNSMHGHGDQVTEEPYGGMITPQRVPSPGPNGFGDMGQHNPGAAEAIGAAAMKAHSPRRSTSNRISAYSGSSHSHDGHVGIAYSRNQPLPPVPDHRFSLHQAYFQNFAPPVNSHEEERGATEAYHSDPAAAFQRTRSTSPPLPPNLYAYSQPVPARTISRQPSLQGLAIPSHARAESHGSRPTLEAIQHGRSRETSSSSYLTYAGPLRGKTSDTMSSTSTPHSHSFSRSATSRSSLTPPSTAFPSPAAPSSPQSDEKFAALPPLPRLPTLPAIPSIERLKTDEGLTVPHSKRPAFGRAASSESFLAPMQWLGARIANADEASTSDTDGERGASVDSLGLMKGDITQMEHATEVLETR